MFKVNSIVLTAALFGSNAVASVSGADCFARYSSSATYSAGDTVSATTTVDVETTAQDGTVTVTQSTETRNYECVSGANSAFCNQPAFVPGGQFSSTAWVQGAVCTDSGTPATAAPPAAWSGDGCPAAYVAGTDYEAAAVVSVADGTVTLVYECAAEPTNLFCGMAGYEPGEGQYSDQAWTLLGSCVGTISPTSSPVNVALADAGGCPDAYDAAVTYEEGDEVALDGLVYQCKAFPASSHCSQLGYEPGTTVGTGAQAVEYWPEAWTVTGHCEGTIAPTSTPSFDQLAELGGCPDEWSSQVYEEGDRVSSGDLVYECKAFPFSGHCGQAGYEPSDDQDAPWSDAWTIVGHCSGSIGPTASPSFDPVGSVGACPDEWVAGSNTAYEEGDMVAVTVSETPLRQVAYSCKAWPFSGFCGQFAPNEFGGDQGWTLAGSCDGSIGPTSSPSFDTLALVPDGCPAAWSASRTDYEAGDMVSYAVSTDPERNIILECREWPNTGYCNQGAGFEPTTEFANLAWTQLGYCDGTIAPTAAPQAYGGTCEYEQCRPGDGSTCAAANDGIDGCACVTNDGSTTCTYSGTVCQTVAVDPWSSSGPGAVPNGEGGSAYNTDDVVRVGLSRFRCREWPNFFWCRQEAYRPSLTDNSIWPQAWRADGVCS